MAAPAESAEPVEPPTCTLRGHITDPSGALIPGAQVTVSAAKGGTAGTATADAAGTYVVKGLTPGSYVVQATFSGFAPFVSAPITLEAGQTKSVNIKMAIEAAQQEVVVTDDGSPQVSIDAGSNSSSIVLKDKDLDALSDDPDELSNELQALAGPSAGPNGGQIYIDGFTGGQLPPKSAIREIRINQNPFSAEYDKLGYGRIEILTKPGTDVLHGRVFAMGNASSFNTGNPFTKTIPPYHSVMFNGSISGALSKKASFFFSMEQRNNQDANIYTVDEPVQDTSTSPWYIPTDSAGNPIPTTGGLFTPATHTEISPRIDLQLGQKNTLTMRYQFYRNNVSGSLGSTSLPTTSSTSNSMEHTIQISDSQVINDHIVNETRIEYRRGISSSTPVSTAPAVSVSGYFAAGGNSGQSSTGHSDHLELQNMTTMTAGSHAIKFGAWLRDNRQATSTNGNFNGSFSFPSLAAYVATLNGLQNGQTVAYIAAHCPTVGACTPNKLTYTTGPLGFVGNVFDGALYFQDDWKFNYKLTLSGGLRWETQNHTADHNDWAPRVAFAYALDGHKDGKPAKTVLRGGYGFFYDRFGISSLMNMEQFNNTGKSQTRTVVSSPTCFSGTSLSAALAQSGSNCKAGSTATPVVYTITPSYHAPYTQQMGASLERQLTKASTLTFTYLHSYGVHQMVTRDSNAYAPLPGTTFYNSTTGQRPNTALGPVNQYFPQAVFKQNQVIVNINAQFSQRLGVRGFYNWTDAKSNTGTASNSYNLKQDFGRASFVRPQMLFLMASYTGPWGLSFNPFMIAQSGKPYNFVTNNDLTGDNFFNLRPAVVTAGNCSSGSSARYAQTSFGCLDTMPGQGETPVPVYMGTNSPSAFALNLRISRSIGIGPKVDTTAAGGPPPPGGGSGGHHDHGGGGGMRGGGFGGGPFGGGGGGTRGGMSGTGRKYSLTFSAQALNLFNDISRGTPSGTVVPTLNSNTGIYGPGSRFGESTTLAGSIFASPSNSAARRIFFQMFFSF